MLDQLIHSLPKTVLALIVIAVGFAVIVASDPPRTVCDSQLELFQQQQKEFLYSAQGGRPVMAQRFYEMCKQSNSPGGCFEFFLRLKKMNQDLDLIPQQCSETVAADSTLQNWIFKSMKLMMQISWGDRGPASVTRKNAWFDASDLSTFCDLKKHATRIYGIEKMDEWREGVLTGLPEADKLDHDSLYQRSLISTPCEAYR